EERDRARAEGGDPRPPRRRSPEPTAAHAARLGSAGLPRGRPARRGQARAELTQADRQRAARVAFCHAFRSQGEELRSESRRIGEGPPEVDTVTGGAERSEPLDAFGHQDGRTVEVAARPVVQAYADLKDAVIEVAHGVGRCPPEQLQRLVLFEELAGV